MRKKIKKEHIKDAFSTTEISLYKAIEKHGPGEFYTNHEMLGVLLEEFDELKEAIHSNQPEKILDELKDVAVVAVFGIAGILQQQKKDEKT